MLLSFGNGSGVILRNPPYAGQWVLTEAHLISKPKPLTCDPKKQKTSRRLGPPSPEAHWLSPKQAADYLGVSRSTVDRMIADGELKAVPLRHGKRKRLLGIHRKVLERFKKDR